MQLLGASVGEIFIIMNVYQGVFGSTFLQKVTFIEMDSSPRVSHCAHTLQALIALHE